jgi:hypothetical protein
MLERAGLVHTHWSGRTKLHTFALDGYTSKLGFLVKRDIPRARPAG